MEVKNDNGGKGKEVKLDATGELNGHSFVDLGLPSGLLWATCNVGATNPEDYGDYFAWGETESKEKYTEETYTYSDNNLTLPSRVADAATANWGEGWRMPTKEEMEELDCNCTYKWAKQNGVRGRLLTGPHGNSIFLPAAGYRVHGRCQKDGFDGYYWSSSLRKFFTSYAWRLEFDSGGCLVYYHSRYYGYSVRAVCQSQN